LSRYFTTTFFSADPSSERGGPCSTPPTLMLLFLDQTKVHARTSTLVRGSSSWAVVDFSLSPGPPGNPAHTFGPRHYEHSRFGDVFTESSFPSDSFSGFDFFFFSSRFFWFSGVYKCRSRLFFWQSSDRAARRPPRVKGMLFRFLSPLGTVGLPSFVDALQGFPTPSLFFFCTTIGRVYFFFFCFFFTFILLMYVCCCVWLDLTSTCPSARIDKFRCEAHLSPPDE